MLRVHFLPALVEPAELTDGVVVVLDILRASTVIATALANGARDVLPCLTIEIAQSTSAALPAGTALLGGERGGLPIPGFDFGNSPCDYTAARVAGRTLIFTTTNGTLAMERCRAAHTVFIGAFVNLAAVADAVAARANGRTIHLLCAGTNGLITREDVLCAGAFVERLFREALTDDSARLALDAWRAAGVVGDAARLTATLHETLGGRNLARLGLAADVADAGALDRFAVAPELDIAAWRIGGIRRDDGGAHDRVDCDG